MVLILQLIDMLLLGTDAVLVTPIFTQLVYIVYKWLIAKCIISLHL